ncbi:MAG: BrnA antitoxin family protein [candidate division KSB1 bacterium]|nr:BrnA antitoxin family protein [candidate division KSB1 bacterium]MDZ7302370.1 BrnA antitoxin family protein [candidate division KSB1 bacterium]MDZ7313975.1 BrnA antitoxin family protein [candidate division KSB1 bacterium]
MKKPRVDNNSLEIPEIPPNAVLRPPRHRPAANARMPRKKVTLALDADLLAWFESEARRGGLNHNDHINEALRQYIIALIGDKPAAPSLSKQQRDEVRKLIDETLARKGLVQQVTT